MRKGTPTQLIGEMMDKIAELRNIQSSQVISASEVKPYSSNKNMMMFYVGPGYPSQQQIKDYAKSKGHKYIYWGTDESSSFRGYYNGDTLVTYIDSDDLPREYRQDAEKFGQPIDAACDDVHAGCDNEVKASCDEDVNSSCADSSAVLFDDDEDVIEADDNLIVEDIETDELDTEIPDEIIEEEEVNQVANLVDDLDTHEYLDDLYQKVEESLGELTSGISWDNDDKNIFLDVAFADGHVFTFTIPKEDLAYDLNSLDSDAEYICLAVRDTHEPTEDALEDDYIPAYV